jgi:hypothetical protein
MVAVARCIHGSIQKDPFCEDDPPRIRSLGACEGLVSPSCPTAASFLTTSLSCAHCLKIGSARGRCRDCLVCGCEAQQVAAITGHTLQSVHRILERYLARTRALAAAAILAFENAPSTKFANRLRTAAGGASQEEREGE